MKISKFAEFVETLRGKHGDNVDVKILDDTSGNYESIDSCFAGDIDDKFSVCFQTAR